MCWEREKFNDVINLLIVRGAAQFLLYKCGNIFNLLITSHLYALALMLVEDSIFDDEQNASSSSQAVIIYWKQNNFLFF